MKYVRTEEGVYEFPKGFTEFNWNNKTLLENEEHIVWTGGEVIAQADTIEELVDEYVLGETKYHKPCVTKLPLDFLRECVITKTHYELVVYGAIWVFDSNGTPTLKPVAKMNDKGDLELL